MRELIGTCVQCSEDVYCKDDFFDGVHEEGKLYCRACARKFNGEEVDVNK
ncbi:hypothetical protein [Oceanobacillus polygoni]|uniref:Uncharacterized protein n=1 Tax=Oceanobacillus polygoni TaxID=1235259 RepID=A0A9X0YTI3_9BACI|nr:hypothetical protein [Oceanobacillus polygoni]MBP2077962.1 hypothetical protein [Oceanobacillus polygoni]